jgi:adenylate kinase family enzyme
MEDPPTPRTLSYTDALRVLGAQDSKIIGFLDSITTIGILGSGTAAVAAGHDPGVPFSLFDAKSEIIRLARDAASKVSTRRMGLSHFTRVERLAAAHAMVAVSSYFEALEDRRSPPELRMLALTSEEQAVLATGGPVADDYRHAVELIVNRGIPMPEPHVSFEETCSDLHDFYVQISKRLDHFIRGLKLWNRLAQRRQENIASALRAQIPQKALQRYQISCQQLAADSPEFEVWLSFTLDRSLQHEVNRARADIQAVNSGLAGLESVLRQMLTADSATRPRILMARSYRAALGDPIAPSHDLPEGVVLPTLDQAYVTPRCRVAEIGPNALPADDAWWDLSPELPNLELFLAGYLNSPRATSFPLIIFGQPGSGKSRLTEIIAARLPETEYLPIRVALRQVAAETSIQAQIEQAIYLQTGEHISWRNIVEEAKLMLPVVLLDGFDELLQAAGINRAAYLDEAREFQQREQRLGYPVVVIVTSRTAVAERADIPPESIALRLEAFDKGQIASWLKSWESSNAASLRRRQLEPLTLKAALQYKDLAKQPLLLFMLALYDAEKNALQHSSGTISQTDLYEALIMSFALRQARKLPQISREGQIREAEKEVNDLALVGLAMFSRHRTLVYGQELDKDLSALNPSRFSIDPHSFSHPSPAQVVVSKFFFIHKSEARSSHNRARSYEFLHATFGEFLVAWLIDKVLSELVEVRSLNRRFATTSVSPLDDSYLHAILSFAALAERVAVVHYLSDLLDRLNAEERKARRELLFDLLHKAASYTRNRVFDDYEPEALTIVQRYATYSANLVALCLLCCNAPISRTDLFGPGSDPARSWQEHVLLWKGSLRPEGWSGMRELVYRAEFLDLGERSFDWAALPRSVSTDAGDLMMEAEVTRDEYIARLLNILSPYVATVGEGLGYGHGEPAAQRLISLWCGIGRDVPDERIYKYSSCFDVAMRMNDAAKASFLNIVLQMLALESVTLPPDALLSLLNNFNLRDPYVDASDFYSPELRRRISSFRMNLKEHWEGLRAEQ